MARKSPPKRASSQRVNSSSRRALSRKVPEGRTSDSSVDTGVGRQPLGSEQATGAQRGDRRAAPLQAVCCVRIAPTATSNGVRAGHQPCGP